MRRTRNIKQGLVLLSLPFVLLLFYNNNSNWHYHQQQNGTLVRHAHPYSVGQVPGTPVQDHPHSTADWLVLTLLSAGFSEEALPIAELPVVAEQDLAGSATAVPVLRPGSSPLLFFRRGPPLAA
ncbi:hypothetical protein [Geofilum rhodophaeum]|uniref:hypothetical protein n=1 Tax=Geofilum rhodophaeum TaxID=1965019 RepID=UPI000B51E836|nr:hypothetical protein [Geofilum rhodophaeum]